MYIYIHIYTVHSLSLIWNKKPLCWTDGGPACVSHKSTIYIYIEMNVLVCTPPNKKEKKHYHYIRTIEFSYPTRDCYNSGI